VESSVSLDGCGVLDTRALALARLAQTRSTMAHPPVSIVAIALAFWLTDLGFAQRSQPAARNPAPVACRERAESPASDGSDLEIVVAPVWRSDRSPSLSGTGPVSPASQARCTGVTGSAQISLDQSPPARPSGVLVRRVGVAQGEPSLRSNMFQSYHGNAVSIRLRDGTFIIVPRRTATRDRLAMMPAASDMSRESAIRDVHRRRVHF
jgi:hypothetical protein